MFDSSAGGDSRCPGQDGQVHPEDEPRVRGPQHRQDQRVQGRAHQAHAGGHSSL